MVGLHLPNMNQLRLRRLAVAAEAEAASRRPRASSLTLSLSNISLALLVPAQRGAAHTAIPPSPLSVELSQTAADLAGSPVTPERRSSSPTVELYSSPSRPPLSPSPVANSVQLTPWEQA